MRAAHQLLDSKPLILDDPMASQLARFCFGSEVVFTFAQLREPRALAKAAMKGLTIASMAAMAGEPG